MKTEHLVTKLLESPPYSLDYVAKQELMLNRLFDLTMHHYAHCSIYRNIIDRVFGGINNIQPQNIEDFPFFPVSLFKTQKLSSVPDQDIIKVLTSSGTTGQLVSRVYLDQKTAILQGKVLVKTTQHFLGKRRIPMVILDHKSVIKDRQSYSARGAGILGMAQFGHRPFYALRDDMSLDIEGLQTYLNNAKGSKVFLFGFTFMVWKHFVMELEARNIRLKLPHGILIHSGGWKKLTDVAVSTDIFRKRLQATTGILKSINFYGMVEQVGGVFFENDLHFLHASNYSDVIIRDPVTLKPLPDGQEGLVQVVSVLPTSYPGHSILTEDLGVIRGVDHPILDMNGRFFEILGRVPKSELRGCSDTFHL